MGRVFVRVAVVAGAEMGEAFLGLRGAVPRRAAACQPWLGLGRWAAHASRAAPLLPRSGTSLFSPAGRRHPHAARSPLAPPLHPALPPFRSASTWLA